MMGILGKRRWGLTVQVGGGVVRLGPSRAQLLGPGGRAVGAAGHRRAERRGASAGSGEEGVHFVLVVRSLGSVEAWHNMGTNGKLQAQFGQLLFFYMIKH